MKSLPPTLNKVIESFTKFPGIGEKTAHRLGLHVLKSQNKDIEEFAQALLDVKNKINNCEICYNISESNICEICSDETRDQSLICVCEESSDIYLIEKTDYRGVYHVLGGLISPLDGIDIDDLNIEITLTLEDLESSVSNNFVVDVVAINNSPIAYSQSLFLLEE